MVDLKLPKLPDRRLVKLTISLSPATLNSLEQYAAAYEAAYGQSEGVASLIPYMLEAFLEADREFLKYRKSSTRSGQ